MLHVHEQAPALLHRPHRRCKGPVFLLLLLGQFPWYLTGCPPIACAACSGMHQRDRGGWKVWTPVKSAVGRAAYREHECSHGQSPAAYSYIMQTSDAGESLLCLQWTQLTTMPDQNECNPPPPKKAHMFRCKLACPFKRVICANGSADLAHPWAWVRACPRAAWRRGCMETRLPHEARLRRTCLSVRARHLRTTSPSKALRSSVVMLTSKYLARRV